MGLKLERNRERQLEINLGDHGVACLAAHEHEHPGDSRLLGLMEQVVQDSNIYKATTRVITNDGSPGVDEMGVKQLAGHLKKHWPRIKAELLAGTYKPQPILACEISKPSGGFRTLGIPTVVDRMVQQAILQVLQPIYDPTFSPHSYGCRPNRNAHQAILAASRFIADGYVVVVDVDLEKFFDRVNHDIMMGRLARRIGDRILLRLIRRYLEAGMMVDGVVQPKDDGTPQGGPLSPLLANILLDDVDKELERRGHRFCRYADDCNVYVKSHSAGARVMAGLKRLFGKLKLKINESKSAVARPTERSFLGFTFYKTAKAEYIITVAPKAVANLKRQIRRLTKRNNGKDLKQLVHDLNSYLRGWMAYFAGTRARGEIQKVGMTMRRRVRAHQVFQWKHPKRIFNMLRSLGVPLRGAMEAAAHAGRYTRLSTHPALHTALGNKSLQKLGLVTLE